MVKKQKSQSEQLSFISLEHQQEKESTSEEPKINTKELELLKKNSDSTPKKVKVVQKEPPSLTQPETGATGTKARLKSISIQNFRCIKKKPVQIDLDNIVVLVGPNNVGKSTILKAYELAMSEGSKVSEIQIEDFPDGKIDSNNLPTIELVTAFDDAGNIQVGQEWIETDTETKEKIIRERWVWASPGKPKRQGYNVKESKWDDKVPTGAAQISNARRPEPFRINAFDSPDEQTSKIVNLLEVALKEKIKNYKPKSEGGETAEKSDYEKLLEQISELQKKIVEETKEEITRVQASLSAMISSIFPKHTVEFDARPEQDLEKCISLFKGGAQLKMGPTDGYMSLVQYQGSGARRTLLWTALRILAEETRRKAAKANERPYLLLMDEPEICLHPTAIRDACKVLYDLPEKTGNWQVMITTHSPIFVDITRDNTTIVRVEQTETGEVKATTVFRPNKVSMTSDDKENLKLLNACDSYFTEFFFGGNTVVVEGDTEFTAFRELTNLNPQEFGGTHVVRARGKAPIVTLVKILNQFGAHYSVLHDSDQPKTKKNKANPAWTLNASILAEVQKALVNPKPMIVATKKNFESAFLGEEIEDEKPYETLKRLQENPNFVDTIKKLLTCLKIGQSTDLPEKTIAWNNLEELKTFVES